MKSYYLFGKTRKSCLLAFVLSVVSGSLSLGEQVEFPQTIPSCPADYLTDSLLASDGSIWVTSEGQGVFRYYPGKENKSDTDWMDASYFRGLPDTVNYYALAEDKQGRIWAGTDNKGVAVFNGESWKTYDRENALLGERVFDIAVSEKTGDVAVATSGGISVFQPSKGDWVSLTRAEGLIEDQVETLAYDGKGNLWLGYACGGVSQLSEKENYRVIKTDQAKWYWDKENRVRQPMDGTGKGLPSNLCNVLLPTRNGTILLGTNSGLALKKDKSEWRYFRGKDYRDKNKGLWDVPEDVSAASKASPLLLPEDYITCMTETKEGCWVGFRQKGAILFNPTSLKITKEGTFSAHSRIPFVRSLLSLPDGSVYSATYGHGLVKIHDGIGRRLMRTIDDRVYSSHPQSPLVKTMEELGKRMSSFKQFSSSESSSKKEESTKVVFWKEDWETKGDWTESYGRDYALLCGTYNMGNDIILNSNFDIEIDEVLGPHHEGKDFLSVRPHNDNQSINPNVLFNPKTGTRVATEWSDNGEEYSSKFDGPDIWVSVKIPEGTHVISLYFHNYQGQMDLDIGPQRDILVEVRNGGLNSIKKSQKSPVISRARVRNFLGSGVYKSFIVCNSGSYNIRILNNYSTDAILNGIFIDGINILRKEMHDTLGNDNIFSQNGIFSTNPKSISFNNKIALDLYRSLKSNGNEEKLKKILNIWDQDSHDLFQRNMLKRWYDKQDQYVTYRSQEFFPFSPRTIPFTADECDVMQYMGINWKDYLPDNDNRPKINPMDLKEKISSMSKAEHDSLKNQYQKKIIEEIAKSYRKNKIK